MQRYVQIAFSIRVYLLVAMCMFGVTACDKKDSGKTITQVAARVNGKEITVHQLNRQLQMSGTSSNDEEAVRKALNTLIDQELLVQQAIKNRLDRDPDILMSIENARRHILAEGYLQRSVFIDSSDNNDANRRFYAENPYLFEKRKVYGIASYYIDKDKLDESLKEELEKAETQDALRSILSNHNIKAQEVSAIQPSEQLPMDLLESFGKAKVGDIILGNNGTDKVVIAQITSAEDRPVSYEQAKPLVMKYLENIHNKKALGDHTNLLRTKAKIDYIGDFSAVKGNSTVAGRLEQ